MNKYHQNRTLNFFLAQQPKHLSLIQTQIKSLPKNQQPFSSNQQIFPIIPQTLFFHFTTLYTTIKPKEEYLMKDNLLFQYIRNAVKEKQNAKPQQTTTFGERYCKQQLIKKKLNKHNPHQKMTHLMKNFRDLDTYVDLPELIENVKKWKFRQLQEKQQDPKPSFIIRQQIHDPSINKKIKKQLGEKIKEKYLNDNTQADQVLQFLEKHTRIRSDGLKNCSYSNLNNLFEEVSQQGDDQTWKGNFDFLQALHKASQSGKLYQQEKLTGVNNLDQKFKDSELNSKPRKEFTKLLHKVTTYLQIILETEHKQKWSNKKYAHKSQHLLNMSNMGALGNIEKQKEKEKQKNYKSMLPPTNPKLINLADLKAQRMKKHKIIEETDKQNNPQMSQTMRVDKVQRKSNFMKHKKELSEVVQVPNNEFNKNYSTYSGFPKFQTPSKINESISDFNRTNLFRSLYYDPNKQNQQQSAKNRNDSFYRTTSSFKFRTQAILNQYPPQNKHKKFNSLLKQSLKDMQSKKSKQAVKQNFTFRNRNIKQKIVNKISGFIREIDEEEHNNKKENNYYNSAINRLENTLSMCFGQFKQEAVAGDADIQTLKRYATHHNHNGPIPMLSSCTFGQLLKLNQGGLFAFNTNSIKTEFDQDGPSNMDLSNFQLDPHNATNTTFT